MFLEIEIMLLLSQFNLEKTSVNDYFQLLRKMGEQTQNNYTVEYIQSSNLWHYENRPVSKAHFAWGVYGKVSGS